MARRPKQTAAEQPSFKVRLPKVTPDVPLNAPHSAAPFTQMQQIALHQLAKGVATAEQQIMALEWIVQSNCRAYDVSYRHGDAYGTTFAEGRRFPGLQIIRLLTLPIIADDSGKPAMPGPEKGKSA